jgi:hypothetical protein
MGLLDQIIHGFRGQQQDKASQAVANGWAKPPVDGSYLTSLPPAQEAQFQQWIARPQGSSPQVTHPVPFDPSQKADYDMRGFWQGLKNGDPAAATAVNANDNQMHFPDKWKTPYHESFSNESKWATPSAPSWNEKDQLVDGNGTVQLDERNTQPSGLDAMINLMKRTR